ncbi:hypothetical protein E6C76_20100 [Pseudothauera nasutitermitis]|uniref:Uncharacterized protein n=2 Tax=Pseudothauera nasutitermitis TaxID=2565930 RepID=A0A4S4APD4_9RHOO|nr:hypothetical protein E6C76_20100 [Pseudothauera nasutitermitis]
MRNHTLGAIAIPEDVWWTDEFAWSALAQENDTGLTGALIIHQGLRTEGRPITLTSNTNGGWVPRGTVLALHAQRALPDTRLTLTLADGREFTVMHDLTREFEAAPVRPACDMTNATNYRITLPLIQTAPPETP